MKQSGIINNEISFDKAGIVLSISIVQKQEISINKYNIIGNNSVVFILKFAFLKYKNDEITNKIRLKLLIPIL